MRRFTVLLAIIALFTGCSGQQGTEAETQHQLKIQVPQSRCEHQESLDICEVVFRYQFKHNASTLQDNAKAYFISILGQDPSDEFLSRFSGNTPPVGNGSEFAIGEGLVFCISSINRIDEDTVQVSGGYYEAELSSSNHIYTVVRKNGKWVVESDEMQWISLRACASRQFLSIVLKPLIVNPQNGSVYGFVRLAVVFSGTQPNW